MEDPNVYIRKRGHLKTEGKGTHHRCLENYSSKVKRRSTVIIFRVLGTGCAGRSASCRTLGRHCAPRWFSGHPDIVCGSDQALRGLPVTEQSSPQVTRGMFALKSQ